MAVKKSIAIIGEGETEWWYFDTLRIACRYKFKVAPDFPQHSDIPHMAKLAEEYVKRDTDYVVCLVDMDRLRHIVEQTGSHIVYFDHLISYECDAAHDEQHRAGILRDFEGCVFHSI